MIIVISQPPSDFTRNIMPKAEVGDIEIAYDIHGSEDGEPVILIMGFGSARDLWPLELIDTLAEHFKVITFDNRGVYESSKGDKEISIPQMTIDTIGLMDTLKIEETNLLGWSMGSLIAQEIALSSPERVKRLVLYASKCGGPDEIYPEKWVLDALTNMDGTIAERFQRMNSTMFPKEFLTDHPDPRDYYPPVKGYATEDIIMAQSMAFGTWKGTYDRLDGIKAPTMMISGDKDMIVPTQNSNILHGKIEHSQMEKIEGAGHGAMFQLPFEFNEKVLGFFLEK